MSKVHDAGKGSEPRAISQKGWESCPLWENLKNKESKPKQIYLEPILCIDARDFPTSELFTFCIESDIGFGDGSWAVALCEPDDDEDLLYKWVVASAAKQNFDLTPYMNEDKSFRVAINPT